jgi:type IV pilus assembly protein PilY1
MLKTPKFTVGCGAFMLAVSTCVSADKLSLAESPLVVAQAVDPNIMILFDTSGSMHHIVPQAPYDPDTTYGSCPGSHDLPTNEEYRLYVNSSGQAVIRWGGFFSTSDRLWGTSGSNSVYACFDPDDEYEINLTTVSSSTIGDPAVYSGNYLNWYFSNDDNNGPADFGSSDANRRPGVKNRNEVAQDALKALIGLSTDEDRLQNARVGLAGFESPIFGSSSNFTSRIYSGLADINISANRTALLDAIEDMPAGGYTPLASALAALGRYFVESHNESLDAKGSSVNAHSLFDTEPLYDGSLSAPAANEIMEYSCQKNFIIAMTDGAPTNDTNFNDDLAEWDDGDECDDDDCRRGDDNDEGDFDDVAAALYDLDLRPETFPNDKNNIITYPIAFSLGLPMLERAADNAGGQYYSANNSTELSAALNAIAKDVQAQVSTVASVAFNSGRLVAGSSIFQAKFNTARYSGQLLAYELASDGSIADHETWDASEQLDDMNYVNRNIFTFDVESAEGVEFAWDNLSVAQQNDLAYPYTDGDADFDTQGEKILDFLRGNREDEGTAAEDLRERGSRLGDIVNSTPVFVGAPELNWPDYAQDNRFGSSGSNYSDFKSSTASRDPVVYVGANDGMLHGFNAEIASGGGEEVFAYIPGAVYSAANATSGLHYLADKDYDHRFYVDLTPVVSDVFIPRMEGGPSAWRTVLIGGLRGGGRGLFALDVTNPDEFSNPSVNADDVVLWEFSSSDDPDLGYTYSQPSIVMMPNGRWAAVVSNGYNSDAEHAYLFIIFLDGGLDGEWTEESDYIKIQAGTTTSSGLSTPRVVDLDGDHVADRVYAGDLQGNLWAFDLSDVDESNWAVAYNDGGTAKPLFTANNGSEAQPITSAPILARNSNVISSPENAPNVLVLFGTGKFLEPIDSDANFELQSYYGVWDAGDDSLSRSDLLERELITKTETFDDPDSDDPNDEISIQLRTIDDSNGVVDWASGDYGWFMDLESKDSAAGAPDLLGERVVTDSLLRREVLLFNTIIPDAIPCSGGGSGWLMSLDYLNGLAPSFAVFDANNDGEINSDDLGYVGMQFLDGLPSKSGVLGDYQYTPGSKGSIDTREVYVGKGSKEGRLSWEELFRQ